MVCNLTAVNFPLNGTADDNLVIEFGGKEKHEGHVPVLFLRQYDYSDAALKSRKAAIEVNTYATVSGKGAVYVCVFPVSTYLSLCRKRKRLGFFGRGSKCVCHVLQMS